MIRIGGVPEHFNLPWHLWMESGGPEKLGIEVQWKDFPGGSGAMIQALEANELDLALVLTEAVVHAKNRNSAIEALSIFVESPLIWGIFSGSKNSISQVESKEKPVYAISRMGSGSHLMAKVDAHFRARKIEENQWLVVQNLDGAKTAFQNQEADLFMWEKWMTKPLVDAGIFKMIDERPTPWPCFLLTGNQDFIQHSQTMVLVKKMMAQVLQVAAEFKVNSTNIEVLSNQFGLKKDDAADWLKQVKWAAEWIEPAPYMKEANALIK